MPDASGKSPAQSGPVPEPLGILAWFAANPLVGLVSFFVGIVSLAATVYFGLESFRERELCLFVHPVRTLIVRGGRSSDLHVLYKGQPVSTDVTALQVGFWNAGNESIKPEHILEPIILRTVPRVPILEAKLHFVSRPVTNILLDTAHIADGELGISWRILEHNDGAVIQFIVAGPVEEEITATGLVEGQTSIASVKPGSWKAISVSSVQIAIIGLLLVAAAVSLVKAAQAPSPATVVVAPTRTLLWRILRTLSVLVAICVILLFAAHSSDSPGSLRFDTTMKNDRPPPPNDPGGP